MENCPYILNELESIKKDLMSVIAGTNANTIAFRKKIKRLAGGNILLGIGSLMLCYYCFTLDKRLEEVEKRADILETEEEERAEMNRG